MMVEFDELRQQILELRAVFINCDACDRLESLSPLNLFFGRWHNANFV